MKKKVIMLLMALCVAFAFTGCKDKNKEDSASDTESAAVTEVSENVVTEAPSEDGADTETSADALSTDADNSAATEKETSEPAEPLPVEDSLNINLGEGEEGAW